MIQQDVIRATEAGQITSVLGITTNVDLFLFDALGFNCQYIQVATLVSCHIKLGDASGDAGTTNDLLLVREHPLILDRTGIRYLKVIQSSEGATFINTLPLQMDYKNSYGSALRPIASGVTAATTLVPSLINLAGVDYPEYIQVSTLTAAHIRLSADGVASASTNSLMVVRNNPLILHTAGIGWLSYLRQGGVNGEINVVPLASIHRRNPPALRVGIATIGTATTISLQFALSGLNNPEYVRIQPFEAIYIKVVGSNINASANSMLVTREAPVILHTAGAVSLRYFSATGGITNFSITALDSMHPDDI